MKIKVLIAEDDGAMCHVLIKALEQIDYVEVVGQAQDGDEAIRLARERAPQVVFLDVAMPGKDGVEAAREICTMSPDTMIIFATAYADFTNQAFEVYAVDYLVKPYKIDRIRKTMDRIKARVDERMAAQTAAAPTMILVKEEGKKVLVDVSNVVFITREERHTVIHTVTGNIKTNYSLEMMERRLARSSFFRSHRGFIINLNMIKEIQPWGRKTCRVIMNNTKETVIMTKARASELEKRLK
ncbi:MAG: LytTR family DNA-binding domain-containing protein [Syntrophomonadaceae bacterium]|nr:LytTR family DNA-binding domain-containing protein [Syntrophomonadaceae bacterium]